MEIAILKPITIETKKGPVAFKAGDTLTLADNRGGELLIDHPEKVCRVSQGPLGVGQRVSYRYPTNIEGPTGYEWEPALGEIDSIDHGQHLALIIPEHEPKAWLWVSLVYVRALTP